MSAGEVTTQPDVHATAIHEAGHAVIGRVLGLACGIVTIEQDHESSGHAIIHDPWATISAWEAALQDQVERGLWPERCWNAHSAFRGTIVAKMAGAEAEAVLLGRCQGGDGDDRYQIEQMAVSSDAALSDDLWSRYEPRMRRQARRLVGKHQATIRRMAKELLARRTLTKDDADALVGKWLKQ